MARTGLGGPGQLQYLIGDGGPGELKYLIGDGPVAEADDFGPLGDECIDETPDWHSRKLWSKA